MKEVKIRVKPSQIADLELHAKIIGASLKKDTKDLTINLHKRSIDARKKQVKYELIYRVYEKNEEPKPNITAPVYQNVSKKKPVLVIGAGPAGLFAALRLIELGLKPILLERGKDVRERRRDLKAINQEHQVNPDSNYCFGEGGAGTYSDGKLYTRSGNKKDIRRILEILCFHGAREDILIDTHPHIGTNKLPPLVAELSKTILDYGGEIHFNKRVSEFLIKDKSIQGVGCADGSSYHSNSLILATGHSARDIYFMLEQQKVKLEAKPFAMGVRVEHPQLTIDQIQYHCTERDPYLPASSYKLVSHKSSLPVYSFCMCPGGFIVPAATAQEEIVVNGMSPSRRDSKFANSGIVVSLNPEQIPGSDPMKGLRYQMDLERKAWEAGGKTQCSPAQRLVDFVNKKVSADLNSCSYQPGISSVDMHSFLPKEISKGLQLAFQDFGSKMKGYLSNDAQILGVESRTSSPVRIPRKDNTLEHPEIRGLFPCGEGAGYAGGIVSAAMDGRKVAEAVLG